MPLTWPGLLVQGDRLNCIWLGWEGRIRGHNRNSIGWKEDIPLIALTSYDAWEDQSLLWSLRQRKHSLPCEP